MFCYMSSRHGPLRCLPRVKALPETRQYNKHSITVSTLSSMLTAKYKKCLVDSVHVLPNAAGTLPRAIVIKRALLCMQDSLCTPSYNDGTYLAFQPIMPSWDSAGIQMPGVCKAPHVLTTTKTVLLFADARKTVWYFKSINAACSGHKKKAEQSVSHVLLFSRGRHSH